MSPESSNSCQAGVTTPSKRPHLAARFLLVLLVCIAAVVVMTNLQLPLDSILFSALQNSGHVLIFCSLAVVSLALLSGISAMRPVLINCLVFAVLMILGFGIELIQHLIGRGFSVNDQLMNLTGVLSGFLIYYCIRFYNQRRYNKGLLCGLAALLLLLAGFFKPIQIAINYLQRPGLPVLADFEEPNALLRFFNFGTGSFAITKAPAQWSENNSRVLQAKTGSENRVRIQLREPHPDWTGYHWLDADIFMADGKEGTILLLLRDRSNWRNEDGIDPYLRFIKITPGLNKIRVPLDGINQRMGETIDNTTQNKALDLKTMQEVVFLLLAGEESRTVFVDNVSLR